MDVLPRWWNPARRATGPEGQYLAYLDWVRGWGEQALRPTLEGLLRGTSLEGVLGDWSALLDASEDSFVSAVRSWRSDYDNLQLGWYVADAGPQQMPSATNFPPFTRSP